MTACMCPFPFIKRAQFFEGETWSAACLRRKWASGRITNSFLRARPFPPPPPLHLVPPVVSRSMYLISLSQAVRLECCLLCRDPSAYSSGFRLWVSPHSFQAPNAIWAMRIQWSWCRAAIRACLIEWGQPSGLLRRAMQLHNALTHHLSDVYHVSGFFVIFWLILRFSQCAAVLFSAKK